MSEASAMEEMEEELEPLFDYTRVQPADSFDFDDSDIEKSAIFAHCRKKPKKSSTGEDYQNWYKQEATEDLKGKGHHVTVLEDNSGMKKKENEEDDWLAPPPPKTLTRTASEEEDGMLRELRLQKKELASLARSTEDLLNDLEVKDSKKPAETVVLDQPSEEREKIVISIQNKDCQKQFCMYKDDKFEKLFKKYAKKVNLKPEDLIFSFDGDKVGPDSTPVSLELEDGDILEVHVKTR